MTNNPFGTDLQSLPDKNGVIDLDPGMLEGTGRILLSQSIVRRFTTRRASVIDAPNDCINIRDFLSDGLTQAQIAQIGKTLEKECEQDQRVLKADVSVQYLFQTKALIINMSIQSSDGPFSLTLSLINGQVSVSVLEGK